MRRRSLFGPALGVVLLLFLGSLAPGAAHAASSSPSATTSPVSGNITGPTYLATSTNGTYTFNATGGPGVVGDKVVGGLNWTAHVSGPNLQGVSISPVNGSLRSPGENTTLTLTVSNLTQTVTIEVEVRSSLGKANATANLTYSVIISVPYIVRAVVLAGATAVLPFTVVVDLDGVRVGNVTVPTLVAHQAYQLVYRYATPGLSAGYHTFVLSVVDEHGLVTFSNGQSSFSTTFYVAPSPPNYAIWYVAGIAAFFGVLFIFATRVAARRRGSAKR